MCCRLDWRRARVAWDVVAWEASGESHVHVPDDHATFRAAVLVPILRAFSDNFLKNTLVFLILFQLGGADAEALITLAARCFIAPFFFLSGARRRARRPLRQGAGGAAAQARRDRRRRDRGGRLRVPLVAVLFFALFLFGVHRRAVRPDQIRHPARPSRARGADRPATRWSRARTFLAILLGTIVGRHRGQGRRRSDRTSPG